MKILKDTTKFGKFFSESYFWKKLQKKVKKIGMKVTYAALLCYYVLKSPDVPKKDKAKIYGALGYFILPIDFFPDYIPAVGYSDDLTALLYCLHSIWVNITPEIERQAKEQLYRWFGTVDEKEIILFLPTDGEKNLNK